MPPSSKDQPEEVQSDEPEDFFETLESDQQKSNELLAKFFLHSDRLFEAEEKLAENLSHQLKPFEAVYKRYPYLVDAQVADTGSVGARLLQPDG